MTNRKAGSLAWRPEVRTPGLPDHTRRLGDLRLECTLYFSVDFLRARKKAGPRWLEDACDVLEKWADDPYPKIADGPLFNVTLVFRVAAGALPSGNVVRAWRAVAGIPAFGNASVTDWFYLRDRVYRLPRPDPAWPDDTLVVFEYMDEDAPTMALPVSPVQPSPTADAAAPLNGRKVCGD